MIVIGGSGSGKTRFYVKPNLDADGENHVSPMWSLIRKGTIIVECGKMLVNGMDTGVKVLNTINFTKSPCIIIRSIISGVEKDILKLVNTIIANTKGEGEKST